MRSLHGLSRTLTFLFTVIAAVAAQAAWFDWSVLSFVGAVARGEAFDGVRADAIDARQVTMAWVQIALNAACAVVFLRWFHRAHDNLRRAGLAGLRYSPRAAVVGFLIPVLNLFRPFQAMQALWQGSYCLSRGGEGRSWQGYTAPALVAAWWSLFLTMGFLDRWARRGLARTEGHDEVLDASRLLLASDLLAIPAALLALRLMLQITGYQEQVRANSSAPH